MNLPALYQRFALRLTCPGSRFHEAVPFFKAKKAIAKIIAKAKIKICL
jgi:hypothetical protein